MKARYITNEQSMEQYNLKLFLLWMKNQGQVMPATNAELEAVTRDYVIYHAAQLESSKDKGFDVFRPALAAQEGK